MKKFRWPGVALLTILLISIFLACEDREDLFTDSALIIEKSEVEPELISGSSDFYYYGDQKIQLVKKENLKFTTFSLYQNSLRGSQV